MFLHRATARHALVVSVVCLACTNACNSCLAVGSAQASCATSVVWRQIASPSTAATAWQKSCTNCCETKPRPMSAWVVMICMCFLAILHLVLGSTVTCVQVDARTRRENLIRAIEGDNWSAVVDAQTASTLPTPMHSSEASGGDGNIVSPFTRARVHRSIGNADAEVPEALPALTVEAVDTALDEVRPYLMADGGNVEVVEVGVGSTLVLCVWVVGGIMEARSGLEHDGGSGSIGCRCCFMLPIITFLCDITVRQAVTAKACCGMQIADAVAVLEMHVFLPVLDRLQQVMGMYDRWRHS